MPLTPFLKAARPPILIWRSVLCPAATTVGVLSTTVALSILVFPNKVFSSTLPRHCTIAAFQSLLTPHHTAALWISQIRSVLPVLRTIWICLAIITMATGIVIVIAILTATTTAIVTVTAAPLECTVIPRQAAQSSSMASLRQALARLLQSAPSAWCDPSQSHSRNRPPRPDQLDLRRYLPHRRAANRPARAPLGPKPPRPRFASSPKLASPRPKSVLARERVPSSPTSADRPARYGSCARVCAASSSRRRVTRANLAQDANRRTPGYGRCHVLALISRKLGIS